MISLSHKSTILRPQAEIVQTKWVAITGGPCSGKSTLFEHLIAAQQHVVPEFAEELIKQEVCHGGDVEQLKKDYSRFSDKIAENYRTVIQSSDVESVIFFNTTFIDHAIYNRTYRRPHYEDLEELALTLKFQKVFFLESHPEFYQQNKLRTEDFRQAQKISEAMLEAYQVLGYEVEVLPFEESFAPRMAAVLSNVRFHT